MGFVKRLKFHIRSIADNDVPIEQMLDQMDIVFRKAQVLTQMVSIKKIDGPDFVDVGNCLPGGPISASQASLFANRGSIPGNEVMVYLLQRLRPAIDACSTCPPNNPSLVISKLAPAWTLPHEVAHLLGLDHEDADKSNLMYPDPASLNTDDPELRQEQIEKIHLSSLLLPAQLSADELSGLLKLANPDYKSIAKFDAAAVPAIMELINKNDVALSPKAARVSTLIRHKKGLEAVDCAVKSDLESVRQNVAGELDQLLLASAMEKFPTVAHICSALLLDKSVKVRESAIAAIQKLIPGFERKIPIELTTELIRNYLKDREKSEIGLN